MSSSLTIGILGGGQLGRMLVLAGIPLGIRFQVFEPTPNAPAAVAAYQWVAPYHDTDTLQQFAQSVNLITYEFENVPLETVTFVAKYVPVYPPPDALYVAQDRLHEKQFFHRLDIPMAHYEPINTRADLNHALASTITTPAILKTRRSGYDGKGQAIIRFPTESEAAWQQLGGASGVPLLLEQMIPFEREVSLIAVRGRHGETRCYPLIQNQHQHGILRRSFAPAPDVSPTMQATAVEYATRMLNALNYRGVLTIEFFVENNTLIANEIAPRVHNSGHWSIEGAETSQFENHIRAIMGMNIGLTDVVGVTAMENIIGNMPEKAVMLAVPHTHVHLYGKTPRPGRKLGHITVRGTTRETVQQQARVIAALCNFDNNAE